MSESTADESMRHETPVVPADALPVPAGPATVPHGARPSQEPNRLVLRTLFRFRYMVLFLIVMTGIVVGILRFRNNPVPPQFLAMIAVPWLLISTGFLFYQTVLPRVTFDREAGLLLLGWRGLRGKRPLSSVIGVQVMQTQKQFGLPEHNIAPVTMNQLNLILDDPAERRLNVSTCDPHTARTNARLVADFLGVPLLDSTGAAAAAAGATNDVLSLDRLSTIALPVVIEPKPDLLLIRSRRLATLLRSPGLGMGGLTILFVMFAVQGVVPWYLVAIVAASWIFTFVAGLGNLARGPLRPRTGVAEAGQSGVPTAGVGEGRGNGCWTAVPVEPFVR